MTYSETVARLYRLGDEKSKLFDKLRGGIDHLAVLLRHAFQERSGEEINLPGGVIFSHWPSGDYKVDLGLSGVLSREGKSRLAILAFSELVAQGWLNQLTKALEQELGPLRGIHPAVTAFLAGSIDTSGSFEVCHNPQMTKPFQVRFVGKGRTSLDGLLPGESCDVVGFGTTFAEAVTDARSRM